MKNPHGGIRVAARELWKDTEKSPLFNTPVLKDGRLYGITSMNEFFCVDAENGKLLWSAAAGGGVAQPAGGARPPAGGGRRGGRGSNGYGSIVDAGAVLVALTPRSELLILEPSDKEFKVLARYKVSDSETFAYPVVAGNRLYVKDRDAVTLWTIE